MGNYKHASIATCEICRELADHESSLIKLEQEWHAIPLAGKKLQQVLGLSGEGALQKCPLCGTYYKWCWFSEYSPSGNEDETHLWRLSPAEAITTLLLARQDKNTGATLYEIATSELNDLRSRTHDIVRNLVTDVRGQVDIVRKFAVKCLEDFLNRSYLDKERIDLLKDDKKKSKKFAMIILDEVHKSLLERERIPDVDTLIQHCRDIIDGK